MNNKNNNKIELLAPAGNLEKLKVAFYYGADAVYVGLDKFSLRARTDNFTFDELKLAVDYAHRLEKKVYVAMNVYIMPDMIDEYIEYLKKLASIRPDGVIISDPGGISLCKEHAPLLDIHLSTQANTCNSYAAEFYRQNGVSRIVTARELSINDIKSISSASNVELEAFVHGAMCISYSGRCLLSAYMTDENQGARKSDKVVDGERVKTENRSANMGDCVHSCRWGFSLTEPSRPGQEYPIEEDSNGTYILSSKDICMIDYIAQLVEAGVTSFKIEGRMKSILYVSSIIRSYRMAIDSYLGECSLNENFINNELNIVSHREFSTGFYFDKPVDKPQVTEKEMYKRNVRLMAMIRGKVNDMYSVKIYNSIQTDFTYELIGKKDKTQIVKIEIFGENGEMLDKANHGSEVLIRIYDMNSNIVDSEEFEIMRMEKKF